MSLTDEEKHQIELEEKKKVEIDQYRENFKKQKKGSGIKNKLFWLVIIFIIAVIWLSSVYENKSNSSGSGEATSPPSPIITEEYRNSLSSTFCNERSKAGVRSVNLSDFISMYENSGEQTLLKPAGNNKPTLDNCKKVVGICLNLWDKSDCENIAERKIWVGMSDKELILSWGMPNDQNNTVYASGVHSQWIYGDFKPYVYLEGQSETDMKVTSWQD